MEVRGTQICQLKGNSLRFGGSQRPPRWECAAQWPRPPAELEDNISTALP